MVKRYALMIVATIAAVTASASPARADWVLTPFAGVSFGGDTNTQKFTYGGTVDWTAAGIFGVELDASIAPDLLDRDDDVDLGVTGSNVTTLMGNIIVAAPLGSPGIRPYMSGGAGLIRSRVSNVDDFFDINDNSFGVNIGAGVIAFTSGHFGLRADVRYFRSLEDTDAGSDLDLDLGSFEFWRATLGAAFRF